MYKSTAKAQQYYERSGSESTKGSRKGFGLLGGGECVTAALTDAQCDEAERHALHTRKAQIEKELAQVRVELGGSRIKSGPSFQSLLTRRNALNAERDDVLVRIQAINSRIRSIRPKPPADAVPAAFVRIAQEVLTAAQFQMILKAAYESTNKTEGSE